MMKNCKLIGFDMDGILCYPTSKFADVFETAFGFKYPEVNDVWMGAIMAEQARTGIEAVEAMFPEFTRAEAQEYLVNFSDLWAREQKLFDGVLPMLQRLRDSSVKLVLITNGPSTMQHAVIDHLGIRDCFTRAFTTGDEVLGINKPNRGCFDKVAKLMNVEAKDCLFIGDGEVNDYQGALGAGWDALWVKPTNDETPQKFSNLSASTTQKTPHIIRWV